MQVTRLFELLDVKLQNQPLEKAVTSKYKGEWKSYSTQEVKDVSDKIALALIELGIEAGDMVAIVSESRAEWVLADHALLQAGVVSIPVYPNISPREYAYIFSQTEIKAAFVSDQALLDKVKDAQKSVPSFKHIFTFEEIEGENHISKLLEADNENHREELNKRREAVQHEDLATIIYTSGTTGNPKGVMLSHKNILHNVFAIKKVLPVEKDECALSFLPLCHIFERTVFYSYFYFGVSIYFNADLENIVATLQEVKPHYFTAVPRLLEKIYEKIIVKGHGLSFIKKQVFFWVINLAEEFDAQGNNSSWYETKIHKAQDLVFSKWKEALGGRIKLIITGAAALQPRLAKIFNAAGIKLREGYGQTETSPVISVNTIEKGGYYLGTVGPLVEGVEVKFSKEEEILVKGDNVMLGYYKEPEKTAESFTEDGWLKTGDKGTFVDGKFLKITGRVKTIFKTSGGKYVSPDAITTEMKASFYIEHMLVLGENQKFASAIIVPNFDYVLDWAKLKNYDINTREDMANSQELHDRIMEDVMRINKKFGKVEQLKKIKIIADEWSVDSGELTATLKLKRNVLLEKYKDLIEEIYSV